jgi:hypothetical protein
MKPTSNLFCSGSSADHCTGNPPTTPTPPAPTPTPPPPSPPPPIHESDSRLIAYLGNWQACPTTAQVEAYTHIVIAFAVSYTWNPTKNQCSSTCQISTPPICNNAPNDALLQQWQAAGKKIILSFGGAGMGGSWAGDNNDCWEQCYGREAQVTSQLVSIVNDLGLDGVDLDFEYHVTDEAVTFLNEVTTGLRNSLPAGSEITHAPMDSDVIPGRPYYEQVLKETGHHLDFLMPQYYNGYTRPAIDGVGGPAVAGSRSALSDYSSIVDNIFNGDPRRMVFGFCISACTGTGSNANADEASTVMTDLAQTYPCNGGAFFWVAADDGGGSWSSPVGNTINALAATGCSNVFEPTTPMPTKSPTLAPTPNPTPQNEPVTSPPSRSPTPQPTPQPTPTSNPPGPSSPMCCEPGSNKLKAYNGCAQYYRCSWGQVQSNLIGPSSNDVLFDESIQNWNWPANFECYVDPCGGPTTPMPTKSPTLAPTPNPTPQNEPVTPEEPCCPSGFTGHKAWNDCLQYYHCDNGRVKGGILNCPIGTMLDENIGNFQWKDQMTCTIGSCGGRRLRGGA